MDELVQVLHAIEKDEDPIFQESLIPRDRNMAGYAK